MDIRIIYVNIYYKSSLLKENFCRVYFQSIFNKNFLKFLTIKIFFFKSIKDLLGVYSESRKLTYQTQTARSSLKYDEGSPLLEEDRRKLHQLDKKVYFLPQ